MTSVAARGEKLSQYAAMQARSALFDLYGDHLFNRGGRAAVAALVRLLAPLEIAPPAVRTAVSRMVRQGWLRPVRLDAGPGYEATAKANRRLDDAATRVYRTDPHDWDGHFDLVLLRTRIPRDARTRLAAALSFLGYGALDASTWMAARPAADVDAVLAEAGVDFERFRAGHAAGTPGAAALVRRAWDLPALGSAYERFVRDLRPAVDAVDVSDRGGLRRLDVQKQAYATRFRLVHSWRTFLFRDPQLPPVLLPEHWAGTAAAEFFDRHADRLRPAADLYVDHCLIDLAA